VRLSIRSFAATVLTLACLAPHTAAAQEVSPGLETLTPEQVRTAFLRGGYHVSEPISFDWIAPPVSTLRVQDGRSDRLLMVLVYSDAATAHSVSDRDGPWLVPGYGPGVVRQNLALVQASERELSRLNAADLECEMGIVNIPSSTQAAFQALNPAPYVDSDFLAIVPNGGRSDV
jgi:hypothetical protein